MNFKKAFTLIEVLLVVGVAAGIFALSAPLTLDLYHRQLVEDARSGVIDALGRARHNAILQKNDSAFGITLSEVPNNYVLFQGAAYDTREASEDEIFPVISGIAFSGLTEIVFSKLTGLPDVTGTITLTYSGVVREILVDSSGVVSKVEVAEGGEGGGEAAVTYNVIFDANGGSGSMSNQAIGENSSANLTANSFTRTSYTFSSWNTAANGSGTSYADSASYTMGSADVTLYAVWVSDFVSSGLVFRLDPDWSSIIQPPSYAPGEIWPAQYGNNGTLGGRVTVTDGVTLSDMGGTYSSISVSGMSISNYPITVMGWWKSSVSPYSDARMVDISNGTTPRVLIRLGQNDVFVRNNVTITSSLPTILDGSWHHYALTVDFGGVVTAYRDGVVKSSNTDASLTQTTLTAITPITGGVSEYNRDFRVYNRVLTTDEILTIVQGNG